MDIMVNNVVPVPCCPVCYARNYMQPEQEHGKALSFGCVWRMRLNRMLAGGGRNGGPMTRGRGTASGMARQQSNCVCGLTMPRRGLGCDLLQGGRWQGLDQQDAPAKEPVANGGKHCQQGCVGRATNARPSMGQSPRSSSGGVGKQPCCVGRTQSAARTAWSRRTCSSPMSL
jgi:hypothetical protein